MQSTLLSITVDDTDIAHSLIQLMTRALKGNERE